MPYQSTEPALYRAISDPTRRAILDLLRHEGLPVQEIAADFAVSRPAISQHLKVLRDAGLVRERRDGRRRIYALEAAPLARVDAWLRSYRTFWERNLESLKEYVEAQPATADATNEERRSEPEPTVAIRRRRDGRRPN